jgi:hypothetical protein
VFVGDLRKHLQRLQIFQQLLSRRNTQDDGGGIWVLREPRERERRGCRVDAYGRCQVINWRIVGKDTLCAIFVSSLTLLISATPSGEARAARLLSVEKREPSGMPSLYWETHSEDKSLERLRVTLPVSTPPDNGDQMVVPYPYFS